MTTKCQCGTHPPAKPQAVELAKLEAILADCRARKAKAKPGTPMPMIACLADKAADLRKGSTRQASAELDRLRAENASLRAKLATGKPASAKPAAPSALSPRDQRRAAAKGTLADQSDGQLQFVASHRSATEADRSAARAELEKRGWTIHPSGSFSQSIRKAPRR